jgi:hypothetical protein
MRGNDVRHCGSQHENDDARYRSPRRIHVSAFASPSMSNSLAGFHVILLDFSGNRDVYLLAYPQGVVLQDLPLGVLSTFPSTLSKYVKKRTSIRTPAITRISDSQFVSGPLFSAVFLFTKVPQRALARPDCVESNLNSEPLSLMLLHCCNRKTSTPRTALTCAR